MTEAEAGVRAALLDVWSYDVFLDLSAEPAGPARSRTEVRFGCREPGAATFAELTATATSAVRCPRRWPVRTTRCSGCPR